ncbi:MAG TPA: hypothetical protein VIS94_17265 [Desulfomonilia bacterium]
MKQDMRRDPCRIEEAYDSVADEFLGMKTHLDFMYFTVDFIFGCLKKCGLVDVDIIEREPYPDVEYQSGRAYVFTVKPAGI